MTQQVPDEAWQLLEEWLPDNDDPDRPVMTLATVDEAGLPDARSVLLSEYDRDGFSLHTDATSRKVGQLDARPGAALVLRWPDALRQLVVRGTAERAHRAETDRAYALRSPYLQRLAWVNTPAVAQLPPQERRAKWADFAAIHPVPDPPASWVGFLVRPTSLTFWTGEPDSVSHRREYRLGASGWLRTELPG
ncbi:pyridoxal 5'-phosphate synthase [Cellulomonas sp. URHE0023]|uniref:pyridoxine/pyridoxamine 5'-phosphate oxidase n=1 Tax=Cellulomonas sp. URHE0023 TaxID=1380354 RepID=UPI00068A46FF|nr:pyridoxamine 5'-phosphate oxidase family protein [Cellulomonas sp. URHE0023]